VYGALALVLATVAAGWMGYRRGVTVERLRGEAAQAQVLREALARVQERQAQAEATYAQMQAEIDRQRRALAGAGRLRDPGARASCGDALPSPTAAAGVSADGPTGAELSERASGFLRDFAERCDRAAAYAQGAHRWAVSQEVDP
jgi:hypothetical protein